MDTATDHASSRNLSSRLNSIPEDESAKNGEVSVYVNQDRLNVPYNSGCRKSGRSQERGPHFRACDQGIGTLAWLQSS